MLSMHSEDTLIRQAMEAGAEGLCVEERDRSGPGERHQESGGRRISSSIRRSRGAERSKGERDTGLTQRELEILQHIVAGKSNKEIASELSLSVNTVSVHRANVMDPLGIHKTGRAGGVSIRNGLVTLP